MTDNLNELITIVFLPGAYLVAGAMMAFMMFVALMKTLALVLRR